MTLGFVLAFAAFACYLAGATLLGWLHLRRTGYSPVAQAVSDYGVGPTGRVFALYVGAGSVGALALTAALWVAGAPAVPGWILGVLVGMAAARTGLSLFPTDLEDRGLTRTGLIHYLFAVSNFACAYVAIRHLTPLLATAPSWEPARPLLAALSWASTPALVANCVTMVKPLRRIFGLCERAFIVVVALWFVTASGWLALTLR
jgi:hypothetical protein